MPIDEVMGLMLGVPGTQGAGITYLFRDTFSDVVAAGAYNNTAATPGSGTRQAIDTENKLSGDGTKLICAGGTTSPYWGNPALVWVPDTPVERKAGVALTLDYTPHTATSNSAYVGWSQSALAGLISADFISALRFRAGPLYVYDGAVLVDVGTYTADTTYNLAFVLRASGSDVLVRGGTFSENNYYTLLYRTAVSAASPMYPAFFNNDHVADIDNVEVIDLSGTPWGEGLTWDSLPVAGAGDTIDAPQDALIECEWTPAAGQVLELSFRYRDDDNRWYVACDQAAGTIKLFSVYEGNVVEYNPGKTQTWTVDQPYRFVVFAGFRDTRVFVDGVRKHHNVPLLTHPAPISGSYGVKTSVPVTNLASAPKYVTLNTGKNYPLFTIGRHYAMRAAAPITTPTSDGSGQVVHPDVIDMHVRLGPGQVWNGYRYWMAMTPYPGGDDLLENPEILASHDGDIWVVPEGLTNPLDDPEGSHNADTDLILDEAGVMWCIWVRGSSVGERIVYARTSVDGVTWTPKQALVVSADGQHSLSPALVWDGAQYLMFCVDQTTGNISRRTAPVMAGPWSAPEICTLDAGDLDPTLVPWHLDVTRDGTRLYALLFDRGDGNPGLYLSYSDDLGKTWIARTRTLSVGSQGMWDRIIYRGSIVRTATGFDMWYSGNDEAVPPVWHAGRTKIVWGG